MRTILRRWQQTPIYNYIYACDKLNDYLEVLHDWLKLKQLELSTEKHTAWTMEVNIELDVDVGNHTNPTVNKPKISGVTLDNLINCSTHAKTICSKLQSRNNVFKSLAGTAWGKDKETILTTSDWSPDHQLCRTWTPQLSDTSWSKLQSSQNAALRIAFTLWQTNSIYKRRQKWYQWGNIMNSYPNSTSLLATCRRTPHWTSQRRTIAS